MHADSCTNSFQQSINIPIRGVHAGVPTFFRALCREASRGGTSGYRWAAWQFAGHVLNRCQVPCDIEDDDWESELEGFQAALDTQDDDAVWLWFQNHYPRCMELVPTRRKDQFVDGVRRAYEEQ